MESGQGGSLSLEMPFETLKCSQCGAVPKETGSKFCAFCGSLLPVQPSVPASSVEARERFDSVQAHPDLPELLDRVPEDPGAPSSVPGVVLLVIAGVLAAVMLSQMAAGGGGLPPALILGPLLLGLLGVILLAVAVRDRSSPIHRNVAVVLDERIKVSGGSHNTNAKTTYYVLLADQAGTRVELEATEELAGRTAPGDIGVAYIRRARLVDFAVVRT